MTTLQVWRPVSSTADVHDGASYTLVGQTFVRLTELRFHEISLPASSRLSVARGDVLGLYYPGSNPVGWTTAPCASAAQRHRFISRSSREPLIVGDTFRFKTAPAGPNACRQYSFAALLGKSLQFKYAISTNIGHHFVFSDYANIHLSINQSINQSVNFQGGQVAVLLLGPPETVSLCPAYSPERIFGTGVF